MTRFTVRLSLVAAAVLAPVLAAAPQGGVEKSIFVTVLDKAGAPLRDLEPAEFLVREDDVSRQVIDARLATEPLFVSLLVDTAKPLAGVPFPSQDLRRGLTTFVKTVQAANAASEVALVELAGASVTTVPFTTLFDDLAKGVGRLVPSQRSSAVLLEGLVDAARTLGDKPGPRRAIVSVTFASPEASTLEPRNVAVAVQQSGAAFWAVTVRGAENPSAFQAGGNAQNNTLAPTREVVLVNLPDATGGLRLTAVSSASLESLLKRIATALTAQYVVTYLRPDGPPVKVIRVAAARGATVLRGAWVR